MLTDGQYKIADRGRSGVKDKSAALDQIYGLDKVHCFRIRALLSFCPMLTGKMICAIRMRSGYNASKPQNFHFGML
jgi:hypothetical protein